MTDDILVNPGISNKAQPVITDYLNGKHYPVFKDISLSAVEGKDENYFLVNKFGSSLNITNAGFSVISHGDTYQVPQVAQTLEFVSNNIQDALNSTGAHEITVEGLDENWDLVSVPVSAHATDGTIPVAIPGLWFRVFRMKVTKAGAYATLAVPSHLGIITLRGEGVGVTWAIIITTDIPHGQTQIGAYTTPKGYDAYIGEVVVHTETNKPVNVFGFKREGANILTPPFSTMRAFTEIIGIEGSESVSKKSWLGPFPAYTDFGWLGKKSTAGTASTSIDFEILLVKRQAL